MDKKPIIYKLLKDFVNKKRTYRAVVTYWKDQLNILGILQKSKSNLKCIYLKKYEINSNEIFPFVKILDCLHLEVFID